MVIGESEGGRWGLGSVMVVVRGDTHGGEEDGVCGQVVGERRRGRVGRRGGGGCVWCVCV